MRKMKLTVGFTYVIILGVAINLLGRLFYFLYASIYLGGGTAKIELSYFWPFEFSLPLWFDPSTRA